MLVALMQYRGFYGGSEPIASFFFGYLLGTNNVDLCKYRLEHL